MVLWDYRKFDEYKAYMTMDNWFKIDLASTLKTNLTPSPTNYDTTSLTMLLNITCVNKFQNQENLTLT